MRPEWNSKEGHMLVVLQGRGQGPGLFNKSRQWAASLSPRPAQSRPAQSNPQ